MRLRRGMVLAVMVGLGLTGCVSKWAYEDQVEINDHLRTVKTEQDIEREGLHADVQALNRSYSTQSVRVTTMEGLVNHAMSELKSIRFTLASMTKEQEQIRGDVTKLHTEASESLQFLRTINEQQQGTKQVLEGVSTKLDALKKPAPVKTAKVAEPVEKKDMKETSVKDKGAVQRSIDQKLGVAPVSGVSPSPVTPPVKTDSPTPAMPAVKAKSEGQVPGLTQTGMSSAPKSGEPISAVMDPVDATKATPPGGKTVTPPVSTGVALKTAEVPQEDSSPLVRKSDGSDAAKVVTPVKQTWGEWISEKLGRKKVQTAQQQAPAFEKKDVTQ